MKKLMLLALLGSITFHVSYGQKYPYITNNDDTLYISSSVKYYVGQKLKMGTGTHNGGDFKWIKINELGFASMMTATNSRTYDQNNSALPSNLSGRLAEVTKIRSIGNERRGYQYQLLLGIGSPVRYQCDIVNAIKYGEIECDTCGSLKPSTTPIIINNTPSISDEIIKLKKLKDEGILTEVEYEEQKKKLLTK